MTALEQRKTKLTFETADYYNERGKSRAVVIEAEPEYAVFRLKGTRHRIRVSWVGLFQFAGKCEADRARRDKQAERDANRKARKGAR
jgi:hypothetical protein